jgi:hypothetical protein
MNKVIIFFLLAVGIAIAGWMAYPKFKELFEILIG